MCQWAFGGRGKDGASREGDPQTNAFAGEGIKPLALKVRLGLNRVALLKLQQKKLLYLCFIFSSECSRCLRLDPVRAGEINPLPPFFFFIEASCKQYFPLLFPCKYLHEVYRAGESPWLCRGIVWKTWGLPLIAQALALKSQMSQTLRDAAMCRD